MAGYWKSAEAKHRITRHAEPTGGPAKCGVVAAASVAIDV